MKKKTTKENIQKKNDKKEIDIEYVVEFYVNLHEDYALLF